MDIKYHRFVVGTKERPTVFLMESGDVSADPATPSKPDQEQPEQPDNPGGSRETPPEPSDGETDWL